MPIQIPVVLVSGALGAGKTTLMRHWLRHKPPAERWAVVVNEFGLVGLDGVLLQQENAARVHEIAGGCVCCSSGPVLRATLNRVIRERPDRILIEPTGLAAPTRLFDMLAEPLLAAHLALDVVATVVDVRVFAGTGWSEDETYADQVALADVLIGAKADLADADILRRFRERAAALFPPKAAVLLSGADGVAFPGRRAPPDAAPPFRTADAATASGRLFPPETAERRRAVSRDGDVHGLGLIEGAGSVYSLPALRGFFEFWPHWAQTQGLVPLRAKAVMRCGGVWRAFNWIDGRTSEDVVAWRRDSRVEFLARGPNQVDWSSLELRLAHCLLAA